MSADGGRSSPPPHPAGLDRAGRHRLIALWLAWDTFSKRGPTITISFDFAAGLTAGQSQLRYKNVVMGTVKTIGMSPDLSHVIVTVGRCMRPSFSPTRRSSGWSAQLFAGNVTGLETLLSGSYIGMRPSAEPGKAKPTVGKPDPPVLQA